MTIVIRIIAMLSAVSFVVHVELLLAVVVGDVLGRSF